MSERAATHHHYLFDLDLGESDDAALAPRRGAARARGDVARAVPGRRAVTAAVPSLYLHPAADGEQGAVGRVRARPESARAADRRHLERAVGVRAAGLLRGGVAAGGLFLQNVHLEVLITAGALSPFPPAPRPFRAPCVSSRLVHEHIRPQHKLEAARHFPPLVLHAPLAVPVHQRRARLRAERDGVGPAASSRPRAVGATPLLAPFRARRAPRPSAARGLRQRHVPRRHDVRVEHGLAALEPLVVEIDEHGVLAPAEPRRRARLGVALERLVEGLV
eukprot:CAMPEP_0174888702 /NCGR_PEP_ID=MMETSP0167-20121228/3977_1 /TAXON_ID=38298 /ORGANISM="Rhodella maculata, Strain CCMP736" /LENGTH=276 /DNA_ID=CAMNT_0016125811 /DNA_START=146 /DNA_END=975 /DNA_ORIENTATION=-